MLTLKARNTYNNIGLQGQLTGGARPQKGAAISYSKPGMQGGILAGNDILNGMTGQLAGGKYSFKNFAHDVGKAEKTVAKVGTNTGNIGCTRHPPRRERIEGESL